MGMLLISAQNAFTLQGTDILVTHLERKAMFFLFCIGKCSDPLPLEDRSPARISGLDKGTGAAPRQFPRTDRR